MLARHAHTIATVEQDHFGWHRGRTHYGLWLVALEDPVVREKVAAARRHLARFLLQTCDRQPHITLFVCGFPARVPVHDDDVSEERLEAQAALLSGAGIRPFSLRINGLNSFASAPYLEVEDRAGMLEALRSILSGAGPEVGRQEPFVPHVTVGSYSAAFDAPMVCRQLTSFDQDPLTVKVGKLSFATYRARELAGALTVRREIALKL